MITRSSITMEILNRDIALVRFNIPFLTTNISLTCRTSTLLQDKKLTLGSKIKTKTNVDLILIGQLQSSLCLYDPKLGELRLFPDFGLQFHEDDIYEIASLETLIDIFFSTSNYVEVLRVRNEQSYILCDDAYVVKTPAIDNILGSGTYSDVYAGLYANKEIAIKRARAVKTKDSIRFELVILMLIQLTMMNDGVRNDFTVHCHGAGKRYSERDLLFELMSLTLEKYILSEECHHELLYTYFCDIIFALQYLHDRCKVVHGDLKPLNIFIGPHPERGTSARIGDFGFADTVELPWRRPSAPGSPLYMAPEILSGSTANTTRSDIYALGMTIVRAINRSDPYPDIKTQPELVSRVVKLGVKPCISSEVFKTHLKLASTGMWCVESRPVNRPAAADLKLEFSTPRDHISKRLGVFSNSQLSSNTDDMVGASRKRAFTQQ